MSTTTPNCSRSRSLSRVVDLIDPRSPTTAFNRTPIQIILTPSNESDKNILDTNDVDAQIPSVSSEVLSTDGESSKIPDLNETESSKCSFMSANNDLSFGCVDLTSRDVSAIVSDLSMDSYSEKPAETTEIIIALGEQIEQVKLHSTKSDEADELSTSSDVYDDSVSDTKPLIKKPFKKLFYTPNKKRSPLVAVDNICPVTPTSALGSPKNVLREKQWKRFQEERKKRGFESDENFQLPLYDVTASAPGKLMLRRQNMKSQHKFS